MNNLSRVLVIVLTVALLVAMVAFPASADITDNDIFYDLCDYGVIDSYYKLTSSSNSITLSLPEYIYPRYVDFVFYCSVPFDSVELTIGTTTTELNVLCINSANYRYRAYSHLSGGRGSSCTITFNISKNAEVAFDSFNFSVFYRNHFSDKTSFSVTTGIGTSEVGTTVSASMDSVGSRTQIPFGYGNGEGYYDFRALVNCDNWLKYDYVDVFLQCRVGSIDSIVACIGDVALPFNVSYLSTDAGSEYVTTVDGDLYTNWVDSDPTIVNIMIRVDFTGIKKTESNVPVIDIRGTYDIEKSTNYFAVLSYSGFVVTNSVNPVKFWFSDLKNFLAGLFNPSDTDTSVADQVVQDNASVESFESTQRDTFEENKSVIIETIKIDTFGPALAFVSSYVSNVFTALGSVGLFYTLPIAIGIVLFVCSRVRGSDKVRPASGPSQSELEADFNRQRDAEYEKQLSYWD